MPELSDIISVEQIKDHLRSLKGYAHCVRYDSYKHIREVVESHTGHLPSDARFGFRVSEFLAGNTSVPCCPQCDSPVSLDSNKNAWAATCGSKQCIKSQKKQKTRETSLERYGTEYPGQAECVSLKRKQTCLDRYGVDNHMKTDEWRQWAKDVHGSEEAIARRVEATKNAFALRGEEIKEAQQKGMLEKYGVQFPMQDEYIKEKAKQTQVERYGSWYLSTDQAKQDRIEAFGCDNFAQTEGFCRIVRKKNIEKYGKAHHLQNEESMRWLNDEQWLLGEYSSRSIVDIASEIEVDPTTVWNYLKQYGITTSIHSNDKISLPEIAIRSMILDVGLSVITSDRTTIAPYELDIYIPSHNLAIEFNGVYWHSEKFKDRMYHQKKSLMCMEKGIQLIHIWEDDWNDPVKREILKQKIKSKLGLAEDKVHARKCQIVDVDSKKAREFMDVNHIQGFVRASMHIGLEHEGEVVACMSLQKDADGVFDLNRYATSKTVVGGFSKLLAHFRKNHDWAMIFTFAHLDYSHGGVYEKNGFIKKHVTAPGMFYVKSGVRYRRERFMKHKLESLLENFDPSLTEAQNMHNHGYLRVYDAGSIRYEMKFSD